MRVVDCPLNRLMKNNKAKIWFLYIKILSNDYLNSIKLKPYYTKSTSWVMHKDSKGKFWVS